MRVLHVNKFLYRRGGAEAYLLDVATLQRAAGDEVALFGMQHPENGPLPYAAHFPTQVDLETAPESVNERLRVAARMFYSPSSRRGLAAVLADFRPDVVHLHNVYHQLSPSVLRAVAEARIPAVMTLHDYKLACPSYLMLADGRVCDACLDGHFRHAVTRRCKDGSLAASALLAAESAFQRRSRAYDPVHTFVCPSRFLAGVMQRAGVYVDRLAVLGNFVDASATTPKRAPGGGAVYVGRLSPEKGVDTLVAAAGRLPWLRVDIVGEGPHALALRALGDELAPGRVRFHGRLPRNRVLDVIRANAVVVVPSRCNENQPMAVLEAFACGVPVVASQLGGLPELVSDGCGALVAPDDADDLADRLEALLGDPHRAHAMGAAARSLVLRRHSPQAHLDALAGIYREAARAPRRRGVSRATTGALVH
ncbi:MAG TPA: glycosyltransferase [Nocardioidaceae bacterium]|nr:glycosyltransferase [Nocardioidaceae bacterium]